MVRANLHVAMGVLRARLTDPATLLLLVRAIHFTNVRLCSHARDNIYILVRPRDHNRVESCGTGARIFVRVDIRAVRIHAARGPGKRRCTIRVL